MDGKVAGEIGVGQRLMEAVKGASPLAKGAAGVGLLGAGYMAYRMMQPSPPTQNQMIAAQNQQENPHSQMRAQQAAMTASPPPVPPRSDIGVAGDGVTDEDKLKERLRLAKEQANLTRDYELNQLYQGALGYAGQGGN